MPQFLDTFTRGQAEVSPFYLENHTSDTGATYINLGTPGDKMILLGNGRIRSIINANNSAAWYGATGASAPLTANYRTGIDIYMLTSTGGNFGLAARLDPSALVGPGTGNCYFLAYQMGDNTLNWYKVRSGAVSMLASQSASFLPGTNRRLEISVVTDGAQVLLDAYLGAATVPFFSYADSAANRILDIGKPGFYSYNAGNSDDVTGVQFANFAADDIAPSGGGGSNTLFADSPYWRYSVLNWAGTGAGAASKKGTVNPGAYATTLFRNLTSLTLNFDTTINTGQNSVTRPVVFVQFDNEAVQYFPIASAIMPTLPAARSQWRSMRWGFSGVGGGIERWTPAAGKFVPAAGICFLGMDYSAGATFKQPARRPFTIAVPGDSIVEGVDSRSANGPYTNVDNNALLGYAYQLAVACNAEVGMFGFGGQAVLHTNLTGTLPNAQNTWDQLWSGQPRDFSDVDLALLPWGTNDDPQNNAGFATGLTNIGTGMRAKKSDIKLLILKNTRDVVSAGCDQAALALDCPVESRLVNSLDLATDSLDNNHPTAQAFYLTYLPIVSEAINNLLIVGTPPTGGGGGGLTAQQVRDAMALPLSAGLTPGATSVDLLLRQIKVTQDA